MASPVSQSLRSVAGDLLSQVDALVDGVVTAISGELPELAADPRVAELFESTVRDNLMSALRVVSGAVDENPAAPPVALEFARRLAQQGVPLTTMLRAYRLGQAAFQQTVIRRLGETDVDPAELVTATLDLSSFAFQFIDSVSEQVVVAYQTERDEWLRQRNATRLARVQAVLDGSVSEQSEVEAATGLPLGSSVRGAVLWIDERHSTGDRHSTDDRSDRTPLDQQLAALARTLGATAVLSVAADGSTLWAWLSGGGHDTSLADFVPAVGVRVALGRPARGVDGFRVTHRQARRVQALALHATAGHGPAVLSVDDVGPLTLVDVSDGEIRAWVATTLGALAADDEAAARLRDTAWSYLASGSSLNAAAAELHLHKNTIQYRLRKAEEARGRPLAEHRLELEVALLATRLLGPAVLTPPT